MLFRPSESSKRITEFYRRYLLTTFSTNKEEYNKQLREALEKDKAIADGPYISMVDPYKKGKTLKELADEGVVSRDILNIAGFHPARALYSHQEESIRKANQGKNLVVTTGTGSGKTESFLIPVINQLLRESENGTLDAGVRTLIIYPMNALVNDQIRRLRELLEGTPITFGRFTGETAQTYKKAETKYLESEGFAPARDSNELISREQMRETPPNILITNYAMLEYMLLRPGDNIIFSDENASKWQYIVFDEAHSYNGAKGIEVSALIRRVKAMLRRDDIRFILTSATLGGEDSNGKIIRFAEALCTAPFDESSIVRSETVKAKPTRSIERIDFNMYRELAEKVRDNAADEKFLEVLAKYGYKSDGESLNELLYDVVLHDSFYYDVRNVLYKRIKSVKTAAKELSLPEEDFTDFIAVASNAVKDGERLFEAKYHMFLRGIEGVYITLNPSNKLFTQRMKVYKENPLNEEDEGYQAYEVSFCDNCNALYIVGEIVDGKLVQKAKYTDDYTPQVFLLDGEFDEEDDIDENTYTVCAVCGSIAHADSINGLQCGHGVENFNRLIMVKDQGETLHRCACCGSSSSQRSIIRPYYLGNEAATAVISTGLYNELPSQTVEETTRVIDDPFFGGSYTETEKEIHELSRQFLAFSDNRQSAAFFASYLDTTYRTGLIKRIIEYVIENNRELFVRGLSMTKFVGLITESFKKYKVYPELEDEEDISREAWKTAIREMSNSKAKNSLMRVGGLIFEPDIQLPGAPKGLDLSKEETEDLCKVLIRTMMRDAVIKPGVTFTEADEAEVSASGKIRGYVEIKGNDKSLNGWMPDDGKTNQRLKYTKKLVKEDETARSLLKVFWNNFFKPNGIIVEQRQNSSIVYLLNPDKIKVRTVDSLFMCEKCRRVSPYNIRHLCEGGNCDGKLRVYDFKEENKDHHYTWVYKNLDIVPMAVREHTAQLSNEHAYDYQKQFKDKKINVLSCSTTFEMGVDVGSLETVFMRNMPPSPANYAQRAGRAGRSLQSAAYAITYCPNNSHDLNYFRNPVTMIEGTIVPPFFNVGNDKIVLRHIFASAFSFFWKSYENLYTDTIGQFMDEGGFDQFKAYLESQPEDLKKYLKKIVPEELYSLFDIENFGWINRLFCDNYDELDEDDMGFCTKAIESYQEDIKELRAAQKIIQGHEELTKKDGYDLARIGKSIDTIKDQRIIEFMSKNNLIPKYGFPVDTVELRAAGNLSGGSDLNLSRDLMNAISEYAPESEIVADGKRIRSRYIKTLTGHNWPMFKYSKCSHCNTLNRVQYVMELTKCKQCGQPLKGRQNTYLIPKFGFIMENEDPKPVGTNKPEKTYRGVISYIGDEDKVEFHEYQINGSRVIYGTSKFDKLAVLNEAPFYVCETCGYTTLFGKGGTKTIERRHKNPTGYFCQTKRLNNFSLGHELKTDVGHIKFRDFNITNSAEAWTILYSLLEGLSRSLNIDRNEISGTIQWYSDIEHPSGSYGFVIFDNTPGGAGYVRQLSDPKLMVAMLKEGYRVVESCTCGGEEADTACYSCLCNYYNQRQHDILKRIYALNFYHRLASSYTDEWDSSRNDEVYVKQPAEETNSDEAKPQKEELTLKPLNRGMNLAGESAEYIWNTVMDDCEDEEYTLIKSVADIGKENIEKPLYRETLEIKELGEKIQPVLTWRSNKVLLFIEDCDDDYDLGVKSGWRCFSTVKGFDANELIKAIEV